MTEPQHWIAVPAHNETYVLAEGPHWDPQRELLSWVDIPAGNLWTSTTLANAAPQLEYHVADDLGVAVPHSSGGWICGVGPSVAHIVDAKVQSQTVLETRGARLNDGKVDPAGRFWVGSKGHHNERGRGHLYRIDLDGTFEEVLGGLTISNGLGWSPDEKTMYLTDSAVGNIYLFDYDSTTGAISNQRLFVHLEPHEGSPDGLTIDAQGHVWTALWGGSSVRQYNPAGELIGLITVPTSHVTSCTFVGDSLRSLAITTAKHELPEDVLSREEHAGAVFFADVDTVGTSGRTCTISTEAWQSTL